MASLPVSCTFIPANIIIYLPTISSRFLLMKYGGGVSPPPAVFFSAGLYPLHNFVVLDSLSTHRQKAIGPAFYRKRNVNWGQLIPCSFVTSIKSRAKYPTQVHHQDPADQTFSKLDAAHPFK